MAESKIRDESWYQVSGWMLTRLGLKGTALQVYAIIYGFSQDGESCFSGSLRYLSDFTGASKNTVLKALRDLVEQGYITKTENLLNGVKLCTYQAALPVQKLNRGGAETEPEGGSKTAPGGGAESAPNNKSLDNKGLENKEDKKEEPLFGSELQAAFDDWLQYKRERKEGYQPTGLKNLISEIRNNADRYGESAVAAVIRKSISSGWKGIFFERLKNAPQQQGRAQLERETANRFEEMKKYRERLKTAGNSPEVKARADALRVQLTK